MRPGAVTAPVLAAVLLLVATHGQWSAASPVRRDTVSQENFLLGEVAYAEAHGGHFATAAQLVATVAPPMARGYRVSIKRTASGVFCVTDLASGDVQVLNLRIPVTAPSCPGGSVGVGTLLGEGMSHPSRLG